jgi:hypothetical protein
MNGYDKFKLDKFQLVNLENEESILEIKRNLKGSRYNSYYTTKTV